MEPWKWMVIKNKRPWWWWWWLKGNREWGLIEFNFPEHGDCNINARQTVIPTWVNNLKNIIWKVYNYLPSSSSSSCPLAVDMPNGNAAFHVPILSVQSHYQWFDNEFHDVDEIQNGKAFSFRHHQCQPTHSIHIPLYLWSATWNGAIHRSISSSQLRFKGNNWNIHENFNGRPFGMRARLINYEVLCYTYRLCTTLISGAGRAVVVVGELGPRLD